MEFINLKERIKNRSTFSFEKINDKFLIQIECIDTKYSVTFSTNIEYQNVGNIDIDGELKNLLINGLIETEDFVNKLGKVENREKNLDILL